MLHAKLTNTRRGFTLTELAIVLGVIGIVLGGIWVAAAKVYQSNRVQTAIKEAQFVLQGYRSLFANHPIDTGDFADITCVGVHAKYFPDDMIPPNSTCATGSQSTYPQHPWNAAMSVQSHQTDRGIVIIFSNLPQNACNQLSQQLVAAPDLLWESLNGTTVTFPPLSTGVPLTATQINTLCLANSTNSLQLMFKAN